MKVKVGIMSFAHLHADSYAHCLKTHPSAELVGIADHDKQRAQAKALQWETQAFDSYEALLASEVQAVIICSENVRHAPLAQMAAAAGKHILCEKPLMTREEDGKAMLAAAQGAGVHLFTAFPCRFSPAFQQMRQLYESGAIGELLALRGTNRGSNPGGWFTDPAQSGGGALIDHTVHVADLIRLLTGQEITEVYAETGNNMFHGAYDDTAMLSMTLQNGVFATLDASWSRPKTFPTWGDVTLAAVGARGIIEMDMFAQHLVHYDDRAERIRQAFWGDNIDYLMVDEFVRVVAGEPRQTLATGEDGYRAAAVALAAYRAAEYGMPLPVRE
ncbi:MAG: Gfo/Idh/MocA family oxidoreductase [Fimbriimonadales bacterium]|nr:MAG: dehydrogenase [Fimbriimonadales bacterium]